MVDVSQLNWDSSSEDGESFGGARAQRKREARRKEAELAATQKEATKRVKAREKRQRAYTDAKAVAKAKQVVRFTPNPQMGKVWQNKPPNPQRVYEVLQQRFTRKFDKLPAEMKQPSDEEEEEEESGEEGGEKKGGRVWGAEESKGERGVADGGAAGAMPPSSSSPPTAADDDALALPPLPALVAADGTANASPLDALYTDEERELLGMLKVKNPEVRLKPKEHEEGWCFDAAQDEGPRWSQDPSWVVAFTEGATNRGPTDEGTEPNLPKNMFDGDRTSQWRPNASLRDGRHWVVLDFRTLKVVDGFRFLSDASTKHTVANFRIESGVSQAGPWVVIDNYVYKNTDKEHGSVETWLGFEVTTRFLRFFVQSSVSRFAPAVQYMAFRFALPKLEFSKARLALNPEHGVTRLLLRGTHFSQHVGDNSVQLVPVSVLPPDSEHPHGVFKPRLQPNTFAGDNILMVAPRARVTGASPACLTVDIDGLELMHAGALAARVTVSRIDTQGLLQVCELFEEVRDPFEFCKEAAHDASALFAAMTRHLKNAELQYCGIREICNMPTDLDEDGTPRDEIYDAIERVTCAMREHAEQVQVQAWGCQALANIAEEHGNRVAIMGFEWIEQVQDAMLTLVQTKVVEVKTQDRKTMKMTTHEEIIVPEEALELAQYGCKLLCYMAYDEKNRDYVAGQGVPAVYHVMTECEHDALVQAYGCEAVFNFIFRCQPAWEQCEDIGMRDVVECAAELDRRDEYLQKRAANALGALEPEGWLGRKLIRDLKLSEAREMVAKHSAMKKRKEARRQASLGGK
eukprot:g1789.t1